MRFSRFKTAAMLFGAAAFAFGLAGTPAQAQTPKKGGNFRVSMNVKDLDDPATFDWSEEGNAARHMVEPLVQIGKDGVGLGVFGRF